MFKKFWNDEEGQGMVEYALIIALIAIVVIGAVAAIGKAINSKFQDAADILTSEVNGEGGELNS